MSTETEQLAPTPKRECPTAESKLAELQKDFDAMKTAYDQAASALEDCRKKLSTTLKVTTEGTIQHLQTPAESPR